MGEQYTSNDNTLRVPGYRRVDLAALYALDRYRLSLALRNALDDRYFTAVGFVHRVFPGEPRNVQATVTARF